MNPPQPRSSIDTPWGPALLFFMAISCAIAALLVVPSALHACPPESVARNTRGTGNAQAARNATADNAAQNNNVAATETREHVPSKRRRATPSQPASIMSAVHSLLDSVEVVRWVEHSGIIECSLSSAPIEALVPLLGRLRSHSAVAVEGAELESMGEGQWDLSLNLRSLAGVEISSDTNALLSVQWENHLKSTYDYLEQHPGVVAHKVKIRSGQLGVEAHIDGAFMHPQAYDAMLTAVDGAVLTRLNLKQRRSRARRSRREPIEKPTFNRSEVSFSICVKPNAAFESNIPLLRSCLSAQSGFPEIVLLQFELRDWNETAPPAIATEYYASAFADCVVFQQQLAEKAPQLIAKGIAFNQRGGQYRFVLVPR